MSRVTTRPESNGRVRSGSLLAVAATLLAGCGDGRSVQPGITELPVPAATGSAEPHLAPVPDGRLVLSWLEPTAGADTLLRYAILDSDEWSEPATIARGSDWFVNWADFPSVVPISSDTWAAHWLRKRDGGTYAYDIALSISADGGATWEAPMSPHSDGTATEHGFVSLFPDGGKIGALWLDGRAMTPDGTHDADGHGSDGAMTLRSAIIGPAASLERETLVDERVCDCCQTDVALSGSVPVAVYRNRSEDEIRDIYVARGHGDGWERGVPVATDRWQITACPVNGPAIDAIGDTVGVAWFTAAGNRPTVKYAVSHDGGKHFETPVEIASGGTLGRVDVVVFEDGGAVVSHLDGADDGHAAIVLRRLRPDGTLDAPLIAAHTAAGRMSGFPQLAKHGRRLVLAWTDLEADTSSRVRAAAIDMP